MDNEIAIKVENVSKKYCKSIKNSMVYGLCDIGKNMLGLETNSSHLRNNEFWALKDVSFNVNKGEAFGVIGPNGSGKSTLLKLLNGIFWPDSGKITIQGRIGALIEVNAGFHPMLTGRENIYANAAIIGMTKKEVDDKFDDIVKFANIGDFIDVPVKHYSSGMHVRLGFSIAVHSEPEVLLVDEVLAVGDSVFVNKCYKKMNELKKKGITIVFISHNLFMVEKFCDKGILLDHGNILSHGDISKVIRDYQKMINIMPTEQRLENYLPGIPYCTKDVEIISVSYINGNNLDCKEFNTDDTLGIRIKYNAKKIIYNPIFQISIFNQEGTHISVFGTHLDNIQIDTIDGEGVIECWIDKLPLLMNKYYVSIAIYDKTHNITFDYWNGEIYKSYFKVLPNQISIKMMDYTPICHIKNRWIFGDEK